MQQFSITAFAGSINNEEVTLINGEDLHAALGIQTPYSKWILRRIEEFGFVRNLDFIGVDKIVRTEAGFFGERDKKMIEYHLTLDMAKELAMVERSEIGRQVRRYFIQIENEVRDAIPAWALSQMEQTQAQLRAAHTLALRGNGFLQRVVRYTQAGLSQTEVAKLSDCSATKVERAQRLLRDSGALAEKSSPALSRPRLEQLSLPNIAV